MLPIAHDRRWELQSRTTAELKVRLQLSLHHNSPMQHPHYCWHCTILRFHLTLDFTLTCEHDPKNPLNSFTRVSDWLPLQGALYTVFQPRIMVSDLGVKLVVWSIFMDFILKVRYRIGTHIVKSWYPALFWEWDFYSANIRHRARHTTDRKLNCVSMIQRCGC